jgi:hypothetical protein
MAILTNGKVTAEGAAALLVDVTKHPPPIHCEVPEKRVASDAGV